MAKDKIAKVVSIDQKLFDKAMIENMDLGFIEAVGYDENDEPIFALTKKGKDYVESGFVKPAEPV